MDNKLVNAVSSVDATFLFIFGASALLLIGIAAAMIFFVIRYSRKRNPEPAQFSGNFWAEVVWIVTPTLLAMGMFWSGWHSYRALRDAPPDAIEVAVTARMWSWDFQYPNGRHSNVLVVPVGKPVKLSLTSVDVLHGFYAPAFRIKIDTVPGMTTHAWFRADKEGEYVVFCSVYCGLQHAKMLSSIRAVSEADYEKFLAGQPSGGPHPGKALLDAKGCLGCHSLDGTDSVGPSLKDVWGREVALVAPGKKEIRVKLDAKGMTMMIMGPRKGVAKGYDAVMPAYADQISPDELKQMLDFLEHGERAAGGPEAGRAVAETLGCTGCHSTDGSQIAGPSLKGLYGKPGMAKDKAVVDRAYIEAVLKDPAGRLGAASSMPAFPDIKPADLEALMQYLESIGERPPVTPDPAMMGTPGEAHDHAAHDHAAHDHAAHDHAAHEKAMQEAAGHGEHK
jgi:cytochrome c oxidase subunit 2